MQFLFSQVYMLSNTIETTTFAILIREDEWLKTFRLRVACWLEMTVGLSNANLILFSQNLRDSI